MRSLGRRGEMGEVLQWIVRLGAALLLLSLLIAQILLITGYKRTPTALELRLYRERLLDGPNGIFSARGVLDLARLDDKTLQEAYAQQVPVFGARLDLYPDVQAIANGTPLRSAAQEPDIVQKYLPLAAAGLSGPGGGLYERHLIPVLYEEQGKLVPGWIDLQEVKLS